MQAATLITYQAFQQDPQAAFAEFKSVIAERETLEIKCRKLIFTIKEMQQLLAQFEKQTATLLEMKQSVDKLQLMIFGNNQAGSNTPVSGNTP